MPWLIGMVIIAFLLGGKFPQVYNALASKVGL